MAHMKNCHPVEDWGDDSSCDPIFPYIIHCRPFLFYCRDYIEKDLINFANNNNNPGVVVYLNPLLHWSLNSGTLQSMRAPPTPAAAAVANLRPSYSSKWRRAVYIKTHDLNGEELVAKWVEYMHAWVGDQGTQWSVSATINTQTSHQYSERPWTPWTHQHPAVNTVTLPTSCLSSSGAFSPLQER
ncbi:uncharacterized protein LOC143030691 [Oratosquilla oratoria]|uniref:uncharacterized protein LOC143030691 n=1 Tax=Oratosquilla oratoria TaxID=337810 RepID=UPI003F759C7F